MSFFRQSSAPCVASLLLVLLSIGCDGGKRSDEASPGGPGGVPCEDDLQPAKTPVPIAAPQPEVLARDQAEAGRLRLDGEFLYWINAGDLTFGKEQATLVRLPKAGGDPTILGRGVRMFGLTMDSSYIYWTEAGQQGEKKGRILRQAKGGGPTTTLYSAREDPWDIEVVGDHIYWLESRDWDGSTYHRSAVMAAQKDGRGRPRTLDARSLLAEATSLWVDGSQLFVQVLGLTEAEEQRIEWHRQDTHGYVARARSMGLILRYELPRGALWSKIETENSGNGASRGDRVFWEAWGEVWTARVGERKAHRIREMIEWGTMVDGFVVDDRYVYVANGRAYDTRMGTVMRISVDSGEPEMVADGLASPSALALDDRYVYWTDSYDGTVMRTAKRP